MKKSLLSTAIAGAMLATSSVAIAQGPAPDLTPQEKAAFACIEQALSIVAAITERDGCANIASPGVYSLGGVINFEGDGACTIDDFTINVDTVTELDDFRGAHVETEEEDRGQVDDVEVDGLRGDFWFSRLGEIMYGDADFTLCLRDCTNPEKDEPYDEHIIKDFFDSADVSRIIIDEGLEVITKDDYPRMKFRQDSEYVPPNSGVGDLEITKVPIAPENSPQCTILYEATVDDLSGGIQFNGNVTILD